MVYETQTKAKQNYTCEKTFDYISDIAFPLQILNWWDS